MRAIRSDAELRQICAAGIGLVYNDFSGRGSGDAENNVLHAAWCSWLEKANLNVPKYFFDSLEEAVRWLEQNRGREGVNWKRCETCGAQAQEQVRVAVRGAPQAPPVAEEKARPSFFAEPEVVHLLVGALKKSGYSVQTGVQVPSGIVDIVASGEGKIWMIEAKGEDKGGYTSAEMNFQVGIGQIVSRMTRDTVGSSRVALAIPFTEDFKRVLKKYTGSVGFERLGLWLFLVRRDGSVKRLAPDEVEPFIRTL